MAEINNKGDFWELRINSTAKPVEVIDEPEKGYKATIGFDPERDKHVVMNVEYSKDKYTIGDVFKKVEQLRNCSRCSTLDKEKLNIERVRGVTVSDSQEGWAPGAEVQTIQPSQVAKAPLTEEPAQKLRSRTGVKEMMAEAFFKTYFTMPGMYFMGMMLGDESMVEAAIPKDPEDLPEFMEELMSFWSGETDFVRSPEEAKEYLEVMKQSMTGVSAETPTTTRRIRAGKAKRDMGLGMTTVW